MIRLNVLVEGRTELNFVRDVLAAHLANNGIVASPRAIQTSVRRGKIHRGGVVTFGKVDADIHRTLASDTTAYLTTMFDLYCLPHAFPGYETSRDIADPFKRVDHLERNLAEVVGSPRFIPYLQLHEFEALLFSDVGTIDATLEPYSSESKIEELRMIADRYDTPEHIDDNQPPSVRLKELFPSYDKAALGTVIISRIGLDHARQDCHHFDQWISKLEALSG